MPKSLAVTQSTEARIQAIIQYTARSPKGVQEIADHLGMSYSGAWNYVQKLLHQGQIFGAARMFNRSATYQSRPLSNIPQVYNGALGRLTGYDDLVLLPGLKTDAEEGMSQFGLYMTELFAAIQLMDTQRVYEIKLLLSDVRSKLTTFADIIKQILDNTGLDNIETLEAISQALPDATYAKVGLRRHAWAEYMSTGRSDPTPVETDIKERVVGLIKNGETDEPEISMPEN